MHIRSLFVSILLLSMLSYISYAQTTEGEFTESTSKSNFELFSDWRIISILATLLTGMLVAIAYMFGISFNMPELKAWASVESSQIIANALIILLLVSTLSFLDGMVALFVNGTGVGINCSPTDSVMCVQQVAKAYTHDLFQMAKDDSSFLVQKSYELGLEAGKREGYSCNMFLIPPCLWISYSYSVNPHLLIDIERFSFILEHYGNIGASLAAQLFFVQNISFSVGPLLLALGIAARSFFATRRLGGLLMAIAIGIMFVFPLMYAFNWLTLNVYVFGDKLFKNDLGLSCPAVCKQPIPFAYRLTGVSYTYPELVQMQLDGKITEQQLKNLKGGATISSPEGDIYQCIQPSEASINEILVNGSQGWGPEKFLCPNECRLNPYPFALSTCKNSIIEKSCAQLIPECKIETTIPKSDPTLDQQQVKLCPNKCKTFAPLKDNCDNKVFIDPWATGEDDPGIFNLQKGDQIGDITIVDAASANSADQNKGALKIECAKRLSLKEENIVSAYLSPGYAADGTLESVTLSCTYEFNCLSSKPTCRLLEYELDENDNPDPLSFKSKNVAKYCTGADQANARACPVSTDPQESCVYAIPKDIDECTKCIAADSLYTISGDTDYNSFVAVDCPTLCGSQKAKGLSISTGEFAQLSGEGMVGRSEIKNAAKLLLPAFILPLLNILVTVMFIKTFSQFFGGDIEIPGLPKVL